MYAFSVFEWSSRELPSVVNPDEAVLQLIEAARAGDCARINSLLSGEARTKINGVDLEGKSALHYAARNYQVAAIRALVSAGAEINMRDHAGGTPLMEVFLNPGCAPNDATVKTLLELGADPTIVDSLGYKALDLAADHPSICKLVLAKVAKFPSESISEATQGLLISIFFRDYVGFVAAISAGADVNVVAADGAPALYLAALIGRADFVEAFMPRIAESSLLTKSRVSNKNVLELIVSEPMGLAPGVADILLKKAFTMPAPPLFLQSLVFEKFMGSRKPQSKVQDLFSVRGAAAGGAGAAGPEGAR